MGIAAYNNYVQAIIHANGKHHNEVIKIERLALPKNLLKDNMDNLYAGEDMSYGLQTSEAHTHTLGEFNLCKIGNPAVEEAVEKDLELPKAALYYELVKRFKNMARLTAIQPMRQNNLDMIDYFINSQRDPGQPFNSDILTKKVFEHTSVKKFVKSIEEALTRELRKTSGRLGGVDISRYAIKKPDFSSPDDHFNGLMFAIHHLLAYSVDVSKYAFDSEYNKYDAAVQIVFYDHFGMDFSDVKKFGTVWSILKEKNLHVLLPAETVVSAAGTGVAAYYASGADSDTERGLLAAASAVSGLAAGAPLAGMAPLNQVAEGFRAWFILQHYFDRRPFLTEIKQTITIKGKKL